MIVFPCSKINLGLKVIGKRDDGYHEIETVFYPVPMCDMLEIVEGHQKDEISFSGKTIGCRPEDNLVIKSIDELRTKADIPPLYIHLHKSIPAGAGLGGGSSDAASALKVCRELFAPEISDSELQIIAGSVGSDCPFFIKDRPSLAKGRGELLSPADIDLSGLFLVIIKPPFEINTSWAYGITNVDASSSGPGYVVLNEKVENWKEKLINDFEAALEKYYPELRDIKSSLYENGALYASVTGSGSAVYGLFRGEVPVEEKWFQKYFRWQGWL
jgi:4-diphosphocytidyl-2-C-methyl-D-erythritol kinase